MEEDKGVETEAAVVADDNRDSKDEEKEKIVKPELTPPPEPPVITTAETNGIDNEDSINLTIGEDEENLLAEEVNRINPRNDLLESEFSF